MQALFVGAGELDKRFEFFFSGHVTSKSDDASPQTIAKDVLDILPDRLCTFSVVHAGELDKRFEFFFSGHVTSKSDDASPQTIAKDVLDILPDRLCTFSVVHYKWSNSAVTGCIYQGKKFGYFTIQELGKAPISLSLMEGKFTKV